MGDGNGDAMSGLKGYLEEIDNYDDELAVLAEKHKEKCERPRKAIAEILESAKEAGLNMEAFKVLLKEHREARKHERRVAELAMTDASDYETMAARLGDFAATPLGQSALEYAAKKLKEHGAKVTVTHAR